MERATAVGYGNATGPSVDEAAPNRLIDGLEGHPAGPAGVRVAPIEPDPVPDPTWDKVTQASWESFPASDAPGWS